MVKRMERTKRIGTDFGSPWAHPYPPQAEKIRFIRSIRFIRFTILSLSTLRFSLFAFRFLLFAFPLL